MPKNYKEQDFEEHIEQHLLASGYVPQPPDAYDKSLCLIPNQVIAFIEATQPKTYEKLQKQYGAGTPQKRCYRLSQEISKRGALEVLRKGIKDRGSSFRLAYFKPASGMNPEHRQLYRQNIEKDILSNIVKTLNDTFGTDFSEEDKVDGVVLVSFQKVGGDILRQAQDAHPEPVEGCLTPDY